MQSGPFTVDQTTSLINTTRASHDLHSQHGLEDHHQPATGRPLSEGRTGPQDPSIGLDTASIGVDVSSKPPAGDGLPLENPLRWVTTSEQHAWSSKQERVTGTDGIEWPPPSEEYSNVPAPGIDIKCALKGSTGICTVADLPNEVLTHILSHLPPSSLSTIALVSRRFHGLVTTPHAWRIAFSRYFPGSDALAVAVKHSGPQGEGSADAALSNGDSERRRFTRLTALASWRSEYIIRTRLLRSLMRGKPASMSEASRSPRLSRSSFDIGGQAAVTYSTGLYAPVTHLHASFESTKSKSIPRFIIGAGGIGWARRTDVSYGKVDGWGASDPQNFSQFEERFPGDPLWGLGTGDTVGVPNAMDLSQAFGMVYGEGSPGGLVYFRSTNEKRGRYLAFSRGVSAPHLGIPKVPGTTESICSVWIAKSAGLVSTTGGLVGILSGSSYGIVTAYAIGTDGLRDQRLGRGEITARWAVSPGVPVIAIAVDDQYNAGRQGENRSWIVVLNALGEVYYLVDLPKRRKMDIGTKLDEEGLECLAWETGRTVQWQLIEPTRRITRPDPYNESRTNAKFPPRSSWAGMELGEEQLIFETKEMEKYLAYKPKHFRHVCEGWDMRRRLEVDYAGGSVDTRESVVVIGCGRGTREPARIRRFTRCYDVGGMSSGDLHGELSPHGKIQRKASTAFFQGSSEFDAVNPCFPRSPPDAPSLRSPTPSAAESESIEWTPAFEEWRTSNLSFGTMKADEITTTAIDNSMYALLTVAEDPLLHMSGTSRTSSVNASPVGQAAVGSSIWTIPGQRSRFFAVGTKSGTIILWDVRSGKPSNVDVVNVLTPLRIIHTDSPQISCIALTALYLVHGGNDGLVQAWDPLASSNQPIRTLNSRFSSRARRRLLQAQAAGQQDEDMGVNLYAAGAICLDPDPTVLRGMMSLGAHLRYWSYSSSAASQYASRKRRLRRSERQSNSNGESFSGTGRGTLKDYITSERFELEREKDRQRKEADRLAGRFGVGLLGHGADEDDVLAYAKMLSEESFAQDEERRKSESDSLSGDSQVILSGASSSHTVTPEGSVVGSQTAPPDDSLDEDIAEALQRSLTDQASSPSIVGSSSISATTGDHHIPIRYAKSKSMSWSPSSSPSDVGGSSVHFTPHRHGLTAEDDDLDFALQLSLAEEESRKAAAMAALPKEKSHENEEADFPALAESHASSSSSSASSRLSKGSQAGERKKRGL